MSELLAAAADRWGTPLYVLDLDLAAANLVRVRAALPGALIAYAVKANHDPSLLRRLVAEGAGCEVVTGVELALAMRAGCPPSRIVMNGVGKTDVEAAEALRLGALVNAESLDELGALLALGVRDARIGLRLNPGIETATHRHLATGAATSKFGIPIDALDAALAMARDAGVTIASVGAHIGSDIDDPAPYRALAARLGALDVPAIDLGGGWASVELARGMADRPGLIVEPGRSLVADAGWLLVRVVRVQPRDGFAYLVADAGMSELIRPLLYGAEHPVSLVRAGTAFDAPATVHLAGPVCEAGDVLAHDIGRWLDPGELRAVGPGAVLAIGRVGAYGAVMASTYNGRPRPAEVVVEAGEARLSRRRETLEDLVARDA
ncbi:MAG: diaminopimelate decarboxylase [Chloroflexota bacterium]